MVIRFRSREITCDIEKERVQWEWMGQKNNGVLISERMKNSYYFQNSRISMSYAASLSATETAQFTCLEKQHNVENSIHFRHQNWVEIAMGKLFKFTEFQFLHL